MKNSFAYLALATIGLLASCSKKEEAAPAPTTTTFSATINGAQQTPANNSTATGTFTGTYVSTSKQLTYTVIYQGLTPTIAHIHTGAPGATGSVAIPFDNLASPITGTATLTPEQADNLLNNRMYVNIHTAGTYSGGEIRGDIKK